MLTPIPKPGHPAAGPQAEKTGDHWLELYKEVCENIRASDDMSFQLLKLVPAIAGVAAGALSLFEKTASALSLPCGAKVFLAVVGFLITLGIFLWEMRNVQKCNWLIERAQELECRLLEIENPKLGVKRGTDAERVQYIGWPDKATAHWKWPGIRERPWGKTEAEWLIYISALLAWLIPMMIVFC
jgi:hypothetical protein